MSETPIEKIAADLAKTPGKGGTRRAPGQYPDPKKQDDHEYRQAYGRNGRRPFGSGLRAAFYAHLPESPRGHVTRDQAQRYLNQIRHVREMGGWSRSERERLRVLERRWEKRAEGRDARFNALGGVFAGTSEKYRRKGVGDTLTSINAILDAERGVKSREPGVKFVRDAKWPLGKPTY